MTTPHPAGHRGQETVPADDQTDQRHLGLRVPAAIWRQVRETAARRGITTRTLILTALRKDGLAIPESELQDRRR